MNKIVRTLILVAALSLASCGGRSGGLNKLLHSQSEMERNYPDFQADIVSDSLRMFLTDSAFVDTTSSYVAAVDSFYRLNHYQPIWIKNIFEDTRLDTLLSHIQRVPNHGLNPEYFEQTTITNLLDSLKTGFTNKGMADIYSSFRQLEYLLTKAYISYATGLKYGFLSPKKTFPNDYFITIQSPDSAHYAGLFAAADAPGAYLAKIQPTDTDYIKLQALLKQYDSLPDSLVSDSIATNYKTVQANLERYRWKRTTPPSEKYIWVNVAAMNLQAIEPGYEPVTMNVCVGKATTNQTPLLESELYYMNLNPTWSVPASIIEKEVYWAYRKDSTYLTKQRMKILKGTEELNPDSIDWKKINPKHFPYSIRQDSGNDNSLGRIKFMFQNPFSVYLHDTPSKRRFLMKDRAVSHGCVRVQNPMDLAYFCLSTKDSVYFDRLRTTIELPPVSKEGKRLQRQEKLEPLKNDIVFLTHKIPLTIDYRTIYTLPDGTIQFAEDIYGFDAKIRKALRLD
ncbi:MAG: L,D-transpeptidase family protein [Candidatus Symbiothrix sp.]|jgi:murein L,D-transpeptidase YcbB/YkuD|nr:L,D-transpeptidase family protein [Candidatus Symbiothrix sp.]